MNSSVYWPDDSLPVKIYCSPAVLTDLETLATDGLLAMPRTGLGIGGLLLGRQSGERLDILKTFPISCSHAMGPSFVLTPEEIAEAKGSRERMDGECDLVGLYCSKPNGLVAISDNDKTLFEALCGSRGQVVLLIRPKLGHVTQGLFAVRTGDSFRLGALRELVAQQQTAQPETEPEPLLPTVPPLPEVPVPAAVREVPVIAAREELPARPYIPPGGMLFGATVKPERRLMRKVVFTVLILLALAAVGFLGHYLLVSGISK